VLRASRDDDHVALLYILFFSGHDCFAISVGEQQDLINGVDLVSSVSRYPIWMV
jgi:hypothetical protein